MSENTSTATDPSPHGSAHSEPNSHAHVPSWAVLAIACAAQFMVVLDVSIVNVALPKMQSGLHMSQSELQWIVNAYALTFAGFLLFGGRAADLFGRKKIFLIGLTIFTGASLVGGFATSGTMLEISRAVQGLGGAILAPSTLSLLTTTYPEQRARARALGIWSATAGSGGAFGVMAGGILTDELSWRWVLFVNVPIGVLLFTAAVVALRESRGQLRSIRGLDLPGTVTVTAGLAVLVYGIVSTNQHPWGSGRTLATLGIAVVLLGSFVAIERFTSEPMVPLRIFRMRNLSSANGIAVAVGAAMFTMFFFLSLYMQLVLGYSALHAGFAFLPGALMIIAGATIASKLVSRLGPRRLLIIGGVLTTLSLWWLSRLPASGSYVVHLLPPMMTVCLGMGLSFVPLTVAAMSGVDRHEGGARVGSPEHDPPSRWRARARRSCHHRDRSQQGFAHPSRADRRLRPRIHRGRFHRAGRRITRPDAAEQGITRRHCRAERARPRRTRLTHVSGPRRAGTRRHAPVIQPAEHSGA